MSIFTKFKTAKPDNQTWSSIFGYRPESTADQRKFGELFAVITISAKVDFQAPTIGGFILDQLQDYYFNPKTNTVDIIHLEKSILSIRDFMEDLLSREPELAESGLDIEMAVAAIKGEVLYVGAVGESKVMITRDGEFAEISEVLIDPDSEGFLRSGSLFTQAGDVVALTTSSAYNLHTTDSWKLATSNFNLKNILGTAGATLLIGNDIDPEVNEEPEKVVSHQTINSKNQDFANNAVKQAHSEEFLELQDEPEELEQDDIDYGDNVPYNETEVTETVSLLNRAQNLALTIRTKLFLPKNKYEQDEEFEEEEESEYSESKNDLDSDAKLNNDSYSQDEQEDDENLEPLPQVRSRLPNASSYQSAPKVNVVLANLQNYLNKLKTLPVGKYFNSIKKYLVTAFYTIDNLVSGYTNKGRSSRNRKPNLRFWAVVATVCVLVVGFGIRSVVLENQKNGRIAEIEKSLTAQEQKFSTQLSIKADQAALSVNSAIEKEKTSKELDLLKVDVNTTLANAEITPELKTRANSLLSSVNQKQNNMLGINAFTQVQLVSDLAVISQSANPTDIAYASGKLYITDKARNLIYQTDLNINSTPIEYIAGLVAPYLITVNKDNDLVIADQNTDSALATITVQNKNVKRHPGLSLASVGELSSIFVWDFNSALYSINNIKQSIFKQDSIAGNYQLTNNNSPWRNDADFAKAVDMQVDGSLFVLIQGKGLQRYFGGEPSRITINGMISTNLTAINTASAFEINGKDLFIADSKGKRIFHLIVDETNSTADNAVYTYVDQFVYQGAESVLNNIKEIVYSAKDRKLFILDGTKIIRLDI